MSPGIPMRQKGVDEAGSHNRYSLSKNIAFCCTVASALGAVVGMSATFARDASSIHASTNRRLFGQTVLTRSARTRSAPVAPAHSFREAFMKAQRLEEKAVDIKVELAHLHSEIQGMDPATVKGQAELFRKNAARGSFFGNVMAGIGGLAVAFALTVSAVKAAVRSFSQDGNSGVARARVQMSASQETPSSARRSILQTEMPDGSDPLEENPSDLSRRKMLRMATAASAAVSGSMTGLLGSCQAADLPKERPRWEFQEPDWKQKLDGGRVVYFGERHQEPALLEAQLEVLREWARPDQQTPAALVLEMFSPEQQHVLDRWGKASTKALLRDYQAAGGEFDLSHYAPLLDAAHAAGVRLVAGFPSRVEARALAQATENLPQIKEIAEMQALLGKDKLTSHSRFFAAMMDGRSLRDSDENRLTGNSGRFFLSQSWKDLVCAKVVHSLMPTQRVMVVTGCGHTDFGLGVPNRVQALVERDMEGDQAPLKQVIITARERNEEVVDKFHGHQLADLSVTYQREQKA